MIDPICSYGLTVYRGIVWSRSKDVPDEPMFLSLLTYQHLKNLNHAAYSCKVHATIFLSESADAIWHHGVIHYRANKGFVLYVAASGSGSLNVGVNAMPIEITWRDNSRQGWVGGIGGTPEIFKNQNSKL